MITYEDDCVGCPSEIGCIGKSCPYKNVKHFYCDYCGDDCANEELRHFENHHICLDCYKALMADRIVNDWKYELEEVNENDD